MDTELKITELENSRREKLKSKIVKANCEFNEDDELVKEYITKGRPSMISIVEEIKSRDSDYYYLQRCEAFYSQIIELGLPTNFYSEKATKFQLKGEGTVDDAVSSYKYGYDNRDKKQKLSPHLLCTTCYDDVYYEQGGYGAGGITKKCDRCKEKERGQARYEASMWDIGPEPSSGSAAECYE